jgi:hypothetical protein
MSSGQYKRHDGFNKTQMKDGLIVTIRKDGSIKTAKDPKSGKIIKK